MRRKLKARDLGCSSLGSNMRSAMVQGCSNLNILSHCTSPGPAILLGCSELLRFLSQTIAACSWSLSPEEQHIYGVRQMIDR